MCRPSLQPRSINHIKTMVCRNIFVSSLVQMFCVLQDGWSALHFSAWAGRQAIVQELLMHGADINLQDKVSTTLIQNM